MIDDKSRYAVADIGGDDRGALALGRFYERIKEENDYDALFVVNNFRPETRDIEGALEIKAEVEYSAKIKFTGIVNNANLGNETTIDTILSGVAFTDRLSKVTGLPVKFTAVRKEFATQKEIQQIKQILPIDPIKYGNWI